MAVMVTAPDVPGVPETVRGQLAVAIAGTHLGSPADAATDLAPMRALGPAFDHVDLAPYPAVQQMFDADVPAGARYYFSGGWADDLPSDLIKRLTDAAAARPGAGCELHVHHLDGAADRVRDEAAGLTAAQRMYGPARYERLRHIKRSSDPDDLFALNQNIRP